MSDRSRPAAAGRVLPILALLALSGCAAISGPPQGKLFERDGVSMVAVPSGSRETYFSDPGARERHCRSPSPDVSFTASEGASFSAPAAAKGVGGSESAARGALSLGGRDPAVLITRELLYRTCELTNNLGLSQAQALELYREVLQVLVKISETQSSAGTAPAQSAAPGSAAPGATATATATGSDATATGGDAGASSGGASATPDASGGSAGAASSSGSSW